MAIKVLEVDEAERLAAAPAVAEAVEIASAKPARLPLPDHLPRERVVHPGPCACPACGGTLRRIGEDVTESLDYVPGRFEVDRRGERPLAHLAAFAGVLQADGYSGFNVSVVLRPRP